MKNLLISFSGGETSAMMLYLLLKKYRNNPEYSIVTVFANTGLEHEKTLGFVKKVNEAFDANIVWIEAVVNPLSGKGTGFKIVDFQTASRGGQPFESVIAKYGIPNITTPHCSSELKSIPIARYAKSVFGSGYYTAIGIRSDEPQRLNFETAKQKRFIYPMATEFPTTKKQANSFWAKMPFRLDIPSYMGNCVTCWKKSHRKLMTIAKEQPAYFSHFERYENVYGNYVNQSRLEILATQNKSPKLPICFFRDNATVEEILADSLMPFQKAKDNRFDFQTQLSLWDSYLDSDNGCSESCEVF